MPERAPTRKLWLVRHGKAASDAPWGGGDRERPLTGRGRRDATALGHRLAVEEPPFGIEGARRPDLAICSAAVRTRQTAELILAPSIEPVPLDSYRTLYEADTDTVLTLLREIDEGLSSVLLVGHNPTIFRLARELLAPPTTEGGPSADRGRLEDHGFPTCALAVLALDVEAWEDIVPGCGRLLALGRPPY